MESPSGDAADMTFSPIRRQGGSPNPAESSSSFAFGTDIVGSRQGMGGTIPVSGNPGVAVASYTTDSALGRTTLPAQRQTSGAQEGGFYAYTVSEMDASPAPHMQRA